MVGPRGPNKSHIAKYAPCRKVRTKPPTELSDAERAALAAVDQANNLPASHARTVAVLNARRLVARARAISAVERLRPAQAPSAEG